MKSLLNRKYEIIIIPPKVFRGPDIVDWTDVLAMSGAVSMDHSPQTFLTVESRDGEYLKKIPSVDAMCDTSEVLVFQLMLGRPVIRNYLNRAKVVFTEKYGAEARASGLDLIKASRSGKGVIFNGEIFRDFERKVYTILMASHIAQPLAIQVRRVVSVQGDGGQTSEKFALNLFNRNQLVEDMSLQKLDLKEVYQFLWANHSEICGEPRSQFMKGMSYVSQIFRNSENPIVAFMWSIAAIEAMLSTSSDKANSGVLEGRLRAVLNNANIEEIIGKFRGLYRYRNAIFHGNVALPYSFDSRNLFGFSGVKHSNTLPIDMAAFTYALALKVLQRFVELKRYDLRYATSIVGI